MGSYQTLELIETFVNYQESIKRCICIIYDPQRTIAGGLKAVKLQDAFIELYKAGSITMEKLKAANVTWHDVFEDIPIRIQSSALVSALMAHIVPDTPGLQSEFDKLSLGAGPLLEKNLDFMNECLDDVVQEQQKVGGSQCTKSICQAKPVEFASLLLSGSRCGTRLTFSHATGLILPQKHGAATGTAGPVAAEEAAGKCAKEVCLRFGCCEDLWASNVKTGH